jgi:hypothetical protein
MESDEVIFDHHIRPPVRPPAPPPPPHHVPIAVAANLADTRKMSKITIFLLREFARAMRKVVRQLEKLDEFYLSILSVPSNEREIDSMLVNICGHHKMLVRVLDIALTQSDGGGLRDDEAGHELIRLFEESLPWYYEYAVSYLQTQKRLSIVLAADSAAQSLAEDFDVEKLRLAPLLHVGVCLVLLRLATSTSQVLELVKLENFVTVVALTEESVLFGTKLLHTGVALLASRRRYTKVRKR